MRSKNNLLAVFELENELGDPYKKGTKDIIKKFNEVMHFKNSECGCRFLEEGLMCGSHHETPWGGVGGRLAGRSRSKS